MIIKIMIIFEYNCQIQSSVMPPKKAMSYHKSLNDGLYPNQYTVNNLKALENLGTTAEFDASKIDQITRRPIKPIATFVPKAKAHPMPS